MLMRVYVVSAPARGTSGEMAAQCPVVDKLHASDRARVKEEGVWEGWVGGNTSSPATNRARHPLELHPLPPLLDPPPLQPSGPG